jgi:hypothetical protein
MGDSFRTIVDPLDVHLGIWKSRIRVLELAAAEVQGGALILVSNDRVFAFRTITIMRTLASGLVSWTFTLLPRWEEEFEKCSPKHSVQKMVALLALLPSLCRKFIEQQ